MMRRLFLILMIALLPVRGWVGDVMAVEMSMVMAAQNEIATESVASYAHSTGARGQFDSENTAPAYAECPGHAGAAPADMVATADNATNGHCNTCGVCQICHTVALATTVAQYPADPKPDALPFIGSTRFASAVTALGQKPPIS